MTTRHVFITGGTGYIGSRLIPLLVARGHEVTAVVRKGSEGRLADHARRVVADPLENDSYVDQLRGADTFVHLIGAAHPAPGKAAQFRSIDLPSIQVAVRAAAANAIAHFVYLSVAHPAPMMKAYIDVRMAGEKLLRESGMRATFLRPWYVLGPQHRWPLVLKPFYWLCERLPPTKEGARRLGLVDLPQLLAALVGAVENPPKGIRVIDVPEIRRLGVEAESRRRLAG